MPIDLQIANGLLVLAYFVRSFAENIGNLALAEQAEIVSCEFAQ
jgi:hypothetical protein